MKVYIFGNGNINYSDLEELYLKQIRQLVKKDNVEFMVCDFRGTDTLIMEFLKSESKNVTVLHIGDKPRYIPDKYKTKVSKWKICLLYTSPSPRDS